MKFSESSSVPPWEIYLVIFETKALLRRINSKVFFVKIDFNMATHCIAALARRGRLAPNWVTL